MASVEYIVPLLVLDRLVLDRVESILPSLDVPELVPDSADQCDVFQLWAWTICITKYIHLELDGEQLEEFYDGDRNAAYDEVLTSLRRVHNGALAADLFRVNALEEANPSFLAELGDRPAQDVKCIPASDDAHYWSLLQSIYSHGKLEPMLRQTERFDVWEGMQMLLIRSEIIGNASELYPYVLTHPDFTRLYEFRPKPGLANQQSSARVAGILETNRERYDEEMTIDERATEGTWQMFRRQSHRQREKVGHPC